MIDDDIDVTILVTNVDEDGTVFLIPERLRVGAVLRARLSDPDGIAAFVTWKWDVSSDKNTWLPIAGPEDNFTPFDRYIGMYLRVTATYTDGEGSGKAADVISDNVVGDREPTPDISVVDLVSGLTIPWDLAFTPDGTMLFTERGGVLSSRLTNGKVRTVTADLSDLYVERNTGLMAIVVDPDFTSNRRFYTCQGRAGREVHVIAWTVDAA